jgi:hypothetical protein
LLKILRVTGVFVRDIMGQIMDRDHLVNRAVTYWAPIQIFNHPPRLKRRLKQPEDLLPQLLGA